MYIYTNMYSIYNIFTVFCRIPSLYNFCVQLYPEIQFLISSFAVNFLNGQSMDGDIALHLNPRAQTRDIFLNSKKAGKWQTEEKVDLPDALSSGKPFRIRVETKKKKFKVWVLRKT